MEEQNSNSSPAILVDRGRWAKVEAQRDADVLRFVGRFRFVTDELLAERFGVSRQQMNLRVRRLAAAGLLQRSDPRTQPALTTLTRKGARAVDLPLRREPRTHAQRDHELALVSLVIQLERAGGARVRTERECRTREAAEASRYSVPVARTAGREEQRWPDIVLEIASWRTALELELSSKGTTRLKSIIEAYAAAALFDEVVFMAGSVVIAQRLGRLAAAAGRSPDANPSAAMRVVPSPLLAAGEQQAIAAALVRAH
ncbi:MAG TPA: helix-turn-helix domain-containing protein [Solirubrobacteraceae bacterium]|jgi:hypothetical protein